MYPKKILLIATICFIFAFAIPIGDCDTMASATISMIISGESIYINPSSFYLHPAGKSAYQQHADITFTTASSAGCNLVVYDNGNMQNVNTGAPLTDSLKIKFPTPYDQGFQDIPASQANGLSSGVYTGTNGINSGELYFRQPIETIDAPGQYTVTVNIIESPAAPAGA